MVARHCVDAFGAIIVMMAPRADSLKEYSRLKGEKLIHVKTLTPIPKQANPDALRVKIGDELIQVCQHGALQNNLQHPDG